MTSACVCQGWFDTKGRGKGGARGFSVCGVRGRPFTVLKAIETELKKPVRTKSGQSEIRQLTDLSINFRGSNWLTTAWEGRKQKREYLA